uniref:Uncharacterized protein n=1 Tax=Anopheles merus TaxID=30066 RepID=A0A182UR59_ANOME
MQRRCPAIVIPNGLGRTYPGALIAVGCRITSVVCVSSVRSRHHRAAHCLINFYIRKRKHRQQREREKQKCLKREGKNLKLLTIQTNDDDILTPYFVHSLYLSIIPHYVCKCRFK